MPVTAIMYQTPLDPEERRVFDTLHLFARTAAGFTPPIPHPSKRQDDPGHEDTSAARYDQAERQAHATRYDQARTRTNNERKNERATATNGTSA